MKTKDNESGLGVLHVEPEGLWNVDFTSAASVENAFRIIYEAQQADGDDDSRATGLFLKSMSVGMVAALADMQRHDYDPNETMMAALNANAQALAFLFGSLARINAPSAESALEVGCSAARGFCDVFLNMFASFAGISGTVAATHIEIEDKRAASRVPNVKRTIH